MNIRTINNHCTVVYENGKHTVFSYDTPVYRFDENDCKEYRLWSGWSATTQRDINAAGYFMNKKKWDSMPVVD